MTKRLKFLLPIANLVLAGILLGTASAQPLWKWTPVPWEVSLSFSINAPANLLRNLTYYIWENLLSPHCVSGSCSMIERLTEMGIFIFGTAFTWYMVGLEIEASRRGSRAMAGFSKSIRTTVNMLLLTVGTVLVFIVVANWRRLDRVIAPPYEAYFYLAWGVALIVVYGGDLARCYGRNR